MLLNCFFKTKIPQFVIQTQPLPRYRYNLPGYLLDTILIIANVPTEVKALTNIPALHRLYAIGYQLQLPATCYFTATSYQWVYEGKHTLNSLPQESKTGQIHFT